MILSEPQPRGYEFYLNLVRCHCPDHASRELKGEKHVLEYSIQKAAVMISIEQWRARIGLFNCKQCSGFLSSFVSPPSSSRSRHRQRRPWNVVQWLGTLFSVTVDSFSFLPATKDHPPVNTTSLPECSSSSTSSSSVSIGTSETQVFSLRRSLLRDLLIVLLIAIVSQQLIISGDIETNPGPTR